jgi:hypothetical protein
MRGSTARGMPRLPDGIKFFPKHAAYQSAFFVNHFIFYMEKIKEVFLLIKNSNPKIHFPEMHEIFGRLRRIFLVENGHLLSGTPCCQLRNLIRREH